MKKLTLLPILLTLAGCSINSAIPGFTNTLSEERSLSGYYLYKNDDKYIGITEDGLDTWNADMNKFGGFDRTLAVAENFCAEQGKKFVVTENKDNILDFRCEGDSPSKLPLRPLPPADYSYLSPNLRGKDIEGRIQEYAKQHKLKHLHSTENVKGYWAPEKTVRGVKLDDGRYLSSARMVVVHLFYPKLNTKEIISYALDCRAPGIYSEIARFQYGYLFNDSEFPKLHPGNKKWEKLQPKNPLNKLFSLVCNNSPQQEQIGTLKRKARR
ncbi:hypothetical protein [Parasutterella muris]|uniref:hypothetical protein n=1 Tax=Parasutterella muris TaxID=2565572 RepID=UPI00203F7725|nr:hypothetical protein [Parasutterella muris]